MGRTREFDLDAAVAAAAVVFDAEGYEGSSMDRLVQATGVHRGSLYAAFGSKRGLFLACLRAARAGESAADGLVLVAMAELAGRDEEVRGLCADAVREWGGDAARELGKRLLDRAGIKGG